MEESIQLPQLRQEAASLNPSAIQVVLRVCHRLIALKLVWGYYTRIDFRSAENLWNKEEALRRQKVQLYAIDRFLLRFRGEVADGTYN